MFRNPENKECQARRLIIIDSNIGAVELFVKLLYGDKLQDNCFAMSEDLLGLLALIDKYDVPSVKAHCSFQMHKRATSEDVLDHILLADWYNLAILLDDSTNFFWRNASALHMQFPAKFKEAFKVIHNKVIQIQNK